MGDKTQVYNGASSIDDFTTYSYPPQFIDFLDAFGHANSTTHNDLDDQITGNANWPIILSGHGSFLPSAVHAASLRFDVLRVAGGGGVEGISFWDESTSGTAVSLTYAAQLLAAAQAANNDVEQWVAVTVNLLSGAVSAEQIDSAGDPIFNYGVLGTFGPSMNAVGSLSTVITLASDGTLFGGTHDDAKTSYAEFSVTVPEPALCALASCVVWLCGRRRVPRGAYPRFAAARRAARIDIEVNRP